MRVTADAQRFASSRQTRLTSKETVSMKLTIEGDFAKRLTVLLKDDASLALAMAKEWLSKVEPDALYAYLLSQDAATDLLVQLLQKAPEKTLTDLQVLAEGKAPKRTKNAVGRKATPKKRGPGRPKKAAPAPKKRGPGRPKKVASVPKKRGPGRPKKAKAKPARKTAAKPKTGKRIRLTPEQVQEAKNKVLKYLKKNAWATRKELVAVATLPTQAAYRRVIVELLDAKEIVAKGERSKRVYGLKKGTRRSER